MVEDPTVDFFSCIIASLGSIYSTISLQPLQNTRRGSARLEAWTIRRCLTLFNGIIRRPHWPREPKIRELIERLGIKLPSKHETAASDEEHEDDDDDMMEEDCES